MRSLISNFKNAGSFKSQTADLSRPAHTDSGARHWSIIVVSLAVIFFWMRDILEVELALCMLARGLLAGAFLPHSPVIYCMQLMSPHCQGG